MFLRQSSFVSCITLKMANDFDEILCRVWAHPNEKVHWWVSKSVCVFWIIIQGSVSSEVSSCVKSFLFARRQHYFRRRVEICDCFGIPLEHYDR